MISRVNVNGAEDIISVSIVLLIAFENIVLIEQSAKINGHTFNATFSHRRLTIVITTTAMVFNASISIIATNG